MRTENFMPQRRSLLGALLAIPLLTILPVHAKAELLTIASAINKAGRQRMLSQRIAKAYAQLVLGVYPDRAKLILHNSVILFETQLAELTAFAPTPEIRTLYVQLAALWMPYRNVAVAPVSMDGLKKIAALNEDVLKTAHVATVALTKYSGTAVGHLVNISGRERMLSQRCAKFYFFRSAGLQDASIEHGLNDARKEFEVALAELRAAPQNTPDIATQLLLANSQWGFFASALTSYSLGVQTSISMQYVAGSSENVLEAMDVATEMYQSIYKV
jgi:hypothetical protein